MHRLKTLGRLNVWHASEMRDLLVRTLDSESSVEIELSPQEEIDVAGLQLLVAAQDYVRGRRVQELHLVTPDGSSPSAMLRAGFELADGRVRATNGR
mgnify:CR=1 FL=1